MSQTVHDLAWRHVVTLLSFLPCPLSLASTYNPMSVTGFLGPRQLFEAETLNCGARHAGRYLR